jgi:hypothetical protein
MPNYIAKREVIATELVVLSSIFQGLIIPVLVFLHREAFIIFILFYTFCYTTKFMPFLHL